MTRLEKVLAAALVAVIIVSAVALIAKRRIPSAGKIRAIGVDVYSDAQCTVLCEFVNWGMLDPGDLAGVTVYVKNSKNVEFNLTLTSENWSPPEAADYLTLSWNYTDAILQPGDILAVLITLMVDPNTTEITEFSFDMVITATEAYT